MPRSYLEKGIALLITICGIVMSALGATSLERIAKLEVKADKHSDSLARIEERLGIKSAGVDHGGNSGGLAQGEAERDRQNSAWTSQILLAPLQETGRTPGARLETNLRLPQSRGTTSSIPKQDNEG